ncbi:MAG: N-acetyltransferase [Bryobacteraceae bacterium]
MRTEFQPANLPRDARALAAFDRKVFPKADCFPPSMWLNFEPYWLLVDGVRAGCCAFDRQADAAEDLHDPRAHRRRTLYIVSTGILPAYQRQGFGDLFKAWQIAFARRHGFQRIVTNTRKRNKAMIALNRKWGFKIVRTVPQYYAEPADAAVFLELALCKRKK